MSGPVKGIRAYWALSTAAASTTPKKIEGSEVALNREQTEIDVTVWSTNEEERTLPGFKRGTVPFGGPWSSTRDAHLAGIFGSTGIRFIYGPGGNSTGSVKYSGTGYLRTYSVNTNVPDAGKYTAEFKVVSTISRGSF